MQHLYYAYGEKQQQQQNKVLADVTAHSVTFWKRETMSPAMVLTRAVISSMKRSGKRFFLGDSRRSVKNKWWIILLT